jgi:hypothetical protein
VGAHCAAADDLGQAWICDQSGGQVLVFTDPFPASH